MKLLLTPVSCALYKVSEIMIKNRYDARIVCIDQKDVSSIINNKWTIPGRAAQVYFWPPYFLWEHWILYQKHEALSKDHGNNNWKKENSFKCR